MSIISLISMFATLYGIIIIPHRRRIVKAFFIKKQDPAQEHTFDRLM